MRVEQRVWTETSGWVLRHRQPGFDKPQLVLTFGAPSPLQQTAIAAALRATYPSALVIGCSTAGEICGTTVSDDTIVATAIAFEHSSIRVASTTLVDAGHSAQVGEALARQLPTEDLVHVLVLAEGLKVNGSDLVSGLLRGLPHDVAVTGGLAGDGARFGRTLVQVGETVAEQLVAVIGLYGPRLRVGYGSVGGWDQFGPERLVTRSAGNVLYELDGEPALDLYRRYLGDHATGLPASGLLFPLSLRAEDGGPGVVRTILAVGEDDRSVTFAGDVPQGGYARLMKANFDRLIDGATHAAGQTLTSGHASPEVAILISCVGRKLVLQQRVEEELESARDVLGAETILTGFYSYGEIAPMHTPGRCELHNQTMTITTLTEV